MTTETDDSTRMSNRSGGDAVAIVGMALTVPGAPDVATFWSNLRGGVESISRLDRETLLANGESPDALLHENYVPAAAVLDGYADFDAEFFGFSPKEAAILDPQHRKFLEVSWQALENAGHPPKSFDGDIGVFGGCGMGSYFYFNICSNPALVEDVGMFLLRHTGNDKDFLTTRVSHVFDLTGPSVGIQTACSTSLVAVHEARKALLDGSCDMALAGGVTIELPQGRGYHFKEGEILSPDGHCHAFDHRAQGTVFGSGAGAVVLRRLSDAIADGDTIFAVIKGSAVNNDGADKASYLAPSVEGQSQAISRALEDAGIPADTIDYVECHGTGTYLGDPIEVAALTEAFRKSTTDSGYCGIGSVKTNIGHLDTAAGVVSLIKATLALKQGEIPPSLGYEAPNPAIGFDGSPFRVNAELTPFTSHIGPRRAAVNSLGVGGTNAHVILEEAPERAPSEEADWPFQLITVSGHTPAALDANTVNLVAWLRENPDADIADVAHTLKDGRQAQRLRRVTVAESPEHGAERLADANPRRVFNHEDLGPGTDIAFMFPGGGAQYINMARDLYETEPVFVEWMDRGLDHLAAQTGGDPRADWLPEEGQEEAAAARLLAPSVQLPLIMIVEFALAKLLQSWGVRPSVLVGHSMGENTAAALAGVMSFENCIDLVLLRGRLFDRVEPGGMLSVPLPEAELAALIGDDLDMASVNAPALCAVSGPRAALEALKETLAARDVESQFVPIDIAAHSRMLDGILDEFRAFLASLDLQAPRLPIISNRTGAPLTAEEATSADYWTAQLRNTVLFGECITHLAAKPDRIYLEVGPGKALSTLTQMNPAVKAGQVISTLRHPDDEIADDEHFLAVIGRLWACGYEADWAQIWGEARRNRLELPTYAFQRSRYFIEPGEGAKRAEQSLPERIEDMAGWGSVPGWRPRYAEVDPELIAQPETGVPQSWLMFMDQGGLAEATAARLEAAGHTVTRVVSGDAYRETGEGHFTLPTEQGRAPYDALVARLGETGRMPDRVAHFWLVTEGETFRPGSSFFDRNVEHGFHALTWLAQALGEADALSNIDMTVFTNGAERVAGEGLAQPEKSLIAGPVGVIPREMPGSHWSRVDLDLPTEAPARRMRRGALDDAQVTAVLSELLAEPSDARVAWRDGTRYEAALRPVALDSAEGIGEGGTWLITGGLGGIGQTLAASLIKDHGARVILAGRRVLPDPLDRDRYLAQNGPADPTSRAIVALKGLEALGGELRYESVDICDVAQLRALADRARADFGAITGVIHAAGVIDDGPFLTKDEAGLAAVLHPKVDGLRALDDVFPDGEIETLLLFASSSTATTPAGQVDYVAANEYLNAVAKSRVGGKTRVAAINWGVWADTGMAAATLEEGATAPEPVDLPLLSETHFDAEGRRILTSTHRASDWVYDEHRTRAGDILLPGTGYVELASEAISAHHLPYPVDLSDLYFFRPLAIAAGAEKEVSVVLERAESGFAFQVRSAARMGTREGTVLHAQAQVKPVAPEAMATLDVDAIAARCANVATAPEGETLRAPQEANLAFGPRWACLRETRLGEGEGLARLALSDAARADIAAGFAAHPALLDQATGWAMELVPGYSQSNLWVPVSYGRIRLHDALPVEIVSHVRLASHGAGDCGFDITLAAPDGRIVMEIENFRMTRLEVAEGFTQAPLSEAEIEVDGDDARAPLSPAERRLRHNITQGIRAEDGAEALTRALGLGRPQVYVSSLDLKELAAQAAQVETEAARPMFEARSTGEDFAAPETPVQKQLAGIWESLLGVGNIGITDDFFDLGGHSLLAVRLFAQVKRAFGTDFPISVLFEAATIEKLAELITERTGDTGTEAPEEAAAPRHRFLVPLTTNRSDKTPLFVVSGMFGNVLNLRHLGLLIGKDRPVYGIQARGLLDDEEPHRTVEEAARDYLAELRAVQPEGPYMIGGFSGGGITAYEMAQQLTASGEIVSVLALLDTPLPVRPALTRRDKAMIKIEEIRAKGPGYLAEWAKNRIAWEAEKRARAETREAGDAAGSFHNVKIEAAFRHAVGIYDLKPWSGPMTLFRPPLDRHWAVSGGNFVSHEREYVFHDNQWTPHAPKVEVIEVPGDHDSMVLVPNVAVLANALTGVIARAERGVPSEAPADHKEAAE